jgi:flavodoxin I
LSYDFKLQICNFLLQENQENSGEESMSKRGIWKLKMRVLKKIRECGAYLTPMISVLFSLALRFPLSRIPYLFALNWPLSPKKLKDHLEWGVRRAVTLHPALSETFRTRKALIIYYSRTGNTEKVALAIERGVRKGGLEPTIKKVSEAFDEDYYDYDLVCFGTPVMHALPPPPVMKLIHKKFAGYRRPLSEVRVPAHPIPGKHALVFVTFSGPHVGVAEALPAGKLLVQEFLHLGFEVKGEWYIVGEFHGWKKGSTNGKLGDIRGRPNAEDLARVEEKTFKLVSSITKCNSGSGEVRSTKTT